MSHLVPLKRLDERAAATLLAQVLLALGYLHDFVGFCHRDIKPDNVLIDARGQPKLADFGLARALPLVLLDQSKPAARETFYSPMGTVEYMPVEIVRAATPYTRVCDFWCVGVLMFEMLAGEMPFSLQGGSKRKLKQSILAHGTLLDHWPSHVPLSAAARDLLQRLIAEPQQRYSNVYAVLSHPWFAQVQLDDF
uniref:Ribosomal protein S6 kinase alpha-4-like n=1 Tax=Dermatophagoides pteronyssinus TaxID=6956 RepID=A0A6P6Y166_DERPT|nr:ribosomal protein S6 kinase alpha-4-like [Dermatophagoides pteronyssinus]